MADRGQFLNNKINKSSYLRNAIPRYDAERQLWTQPEVNYGVAKPQPQT